MDPITSNNNNSTPSPTLSTVLTVLSPPVRSPASSLGIGNETPSEEGGGREREHDGQEAAERRRRRRRERRAASEDGGQPATTSEDGDDADATHEEDESALLYRWDGSQEGADDDDDEDEDDWDQPLNPERRSSTDSRREYHSRPSSHHHQGRLTKGQQRRVYGGGKHADDSSGAAGADQLGVMGVAGLILAGTAGPTPLLFAHAIALLGLPLFVPLICGISLLVWFSYVVIGVEARYTGTSSWPALASSVFPHRFKSHKVGELITSSFVVMCSIGRGVVSVLAASEIIADLLAVLPQSVIGDHEAKQWQRISIVGAIAILWTSVPLLLLPLLRLCLPRRNRSSADPKTTLSLLPAYLSFFLWPLALLILGVRLKAINAASSHALLSAVGLSSSSSSSSLSASSSATILEKRSAEATGFSVCRGISILLFSLSSHYDVFRYLGTLKRPHNSTTRAGVLPSSSPSAAKSMASKAKRNQWPLAAGLGVISTVALHIGWGLVGYLGARNGGREPNLLANSALAVDDTWLGFMRLLLLLAILVGVEGSLEAAYGRVRKTLEISVEEMASGGVMSLSMGASGGAAGGGGGEVRSSSGSGSYAPLHRAVGGAIDDSDEGRSGSSSRQRWDWRTFVARLLVWILLFVIAMLACAQGSKGEGMAKVAEVVGASGSSMMGFLGPSLFFIALFHLRRPRSIFIADPSSATFVTDQLLVRKERQVQRRLSGRRIWIDILVFAVCGAYLAFFVSFLISFK